MVTLTEELGLEVIRALRGETIPFELDEVVDSGGAAVADLAGWTVVFTLKHALADAEAVLTKTSAGAGGVVISGPKATLEISAAECAALDSGHFHHWRATFTDPQGRVGVPRKGLLLLSSS